MYRNWSCRRTIHYSAFINRHSNTINHVCDNSVKEFEPAAQTLAGKGLRTDQGGNNKSEAGVYSDVVYDTSAVDLNES